MEPEQLGERMRSRLMRALDHMGERISSTPQADGLTVSRQLESAASYDTATGMLTVRGEIVLRISRDASTPDATIEDQWEQLGRELAGLQTNKETA